MPLAFKHVDEIKAELEAVRAKKQDKPKREKRDWYGLVYCDDNGYASIVGRELKGIWLGKTEDIIPYLRSKNIDGENIDLVVQASKEFWSERKSQSCHLATESCTPCPITLIEKPNRATFKNNPEFSRLLEHLVSEDQGIPTIQGTLKAQGYDVPYRSLGRWVKKVREEVLIKN
jgi:hypothetical protein